MTQKRVGAAAIPTHLVVFMYGSVCIATCVHRSRPQVTALMNEVCVRVTTLHRFGRGHSTKEGNPYIGIFELDSGWE